MRNTAGRGGERLAKTFQNSADQGNYAAKLAVWTGKKASGGSWDARRSAVGEKAQTLTETNLGKGLPFKENAGVGGFAASKAEKKKKDEAKLDDIVNRYVKDRNWAGLAEALKSRNPDEQKYMYKKLSERDRVALDVALAKADPVSGPALSAKLREKLPIDDQVKAYTNSKSPTKWSDLATFMLSKDMAAKPDEQDYVYEKLSPRDRVELDKALAPMTGGPTLTTRMRGALSAEDREKTEEAAKKEKNESKSKTRIANIEALVAATAGRGTAPTNPTTGRPYTYAELVPASTGFSTTDASKLSVEALRDPEVIKLLSAGHLENIMAKHDNFDQIKGDMLRVISPLIVGPATSYPLQTEQQNYIKSTGTIKSRWGMP